MMSNDVWRRSEIESPCVRICVVHPDTRMCTGCARTIDEIGAWSVMSAEERRRIMDELPTREAAPKKRRGGRSARLANRD